MYVCVVAAAPFIQLTPRQTGNVNTKQLTS